MRAAAWALHLGVNYDRLGRLHLRPGRRAPVGYLMLVGLLSATVFVLLIVLSALPAFFAPLCPA